MKRLLIGMMLLSAPVFAAHEQLIEQTLPKVVEIHVKGVIESPIHLSVETSTKAVGILGSGSLISPDGFVLTCNHLFEHSMTGMVITVKTANGKKYRGLLLGQNKDADLALVRIFPMTGPLPYFHIGKRLRQGQRVLSFGSPLGIEKTVTFGYISNAAAKHPQDTRVYTMHTASINPGNSGGPLVNTAGELVGVNVASFMSGMFTTAEGMHLAVRLQDIKKFLGDK